MITIKQIHYALAVAKTLHFKKAAEACHVSQSALSTAISECEKQLGWQLFERNNKKVLITPEGKVFIEKAQKIKLAIDELAELKHVNQPPLTSPMTIGVIPTIGPYLLPKVLPELRKSYPNFKINIVEERSHILVDRVKSGDIDVAILALPFALNGLIAFQFWQEDFYWVSHKSDCPSNLDEITSDQLELEKLMLLKEGHCLKDHVLSACNLPSTDSNASFNATSLYTLIQMVVGKLGTTLVPQMALDQLIYPESDLIAVHLNEPGPHRRLAFVQRPNYTKTGDVELLITLFAQQLKQYR